MPDPLGEVITWKHLLRNGKRANDCVQHIDEMGGMIPAVERGFPRTEIANASYEFRHEVETGEAEITSVNTFIGQDEDPDRTVQLMNLLQRHQLTN